MKVRIDEVECMFETLISHLKERGVYEVDVEDYYWDISIQDSFNIHNPHPEITLGYIPEEYEYLRRMCTGKDDVISYGLVWLSSILKAIGDKVDG